MNHIIFSHCKSQCKNNVQFRHFVWHFLMTRLSGRQAHEASRKMRVNKNGARGNCSASSSSATMLTLTRRFWFLAPLIKSRHTFSKERTFLEVSVMRIRCTDAESPPWGFSMSLGAAAYGFKIKCASLRLCCRVIHS